MNIYEARWNNVLKWANKIKEHFDTGKYMIQWGDTFYPDEFDFHIHEMNRTISINSKDNTSIHQIYEYDLDLDHGSHTTIAGTNKMLAKINLYSMTKVEL